MLKKCGWQLVCLMLACAAFCHAEEPVVIVSSDYEPCTSSKNNGSGVLLDIVKQAFGEVHINVVFEFYPWKRCEMKVNKGSAFGAVPYFKSAERLKKYNFSDPIIYSFNRFFYNKEKFPKGFEWKVLEDFQGYRMGGILGYWYVSSFKKAGLKTDLVVTDVQNLKKLIWQRIDFTVFDELTVERLLRDNYSKKMDKIGMLDKAESQAEFHLLVSRAYPDSDRITEQFNCGLRMLKEKGTYLQILKNYNMPVHFAVP